jgi:Obg family GTPase CgtA-like protein
MIERIVIIDNVDPVSFYGVNNSNMQLIRNLFPKLRMAARGSVIKVIGDDKETAEFEKKIGKKVIPVCAIIHEGLEQLIDTVYKTLKTLPESKPMEFEKFEYARPSDGELEIERDDDGAFVLYGGIVDVLVRNVVLSDEESFRYFQKLLREKGVIKALRARGVKDGDIIRIYDTEFEYTE